MATEAEGIADSDVARFVELQLRLGGCFIAWVVGSACGSELNGY
jgi:hypothetical protein